MIPWCRFTTGALAASEHLTHQHDRWTIDFVCYLEHLLPLDKTRSLSPHDGRAPRLIKMQISNDTLVQWIHRRIFVISKLQIN